MERNPFFPLGPVPYPWGMLTAFWKQAEHNATLWGDILKKFMLLHEAFASPPPLPTPRP